MDKEREKRREWIKKQRQQRNGDRERDKKGMDKEREK